MRLFVAVPVPEEIKQHLSAPLDRLSDMTAVRWIPLESLHITLKFIGQADKNQVSSISKNLDAVALQHAPFSLLCESAGVFPTSHRPRVFWTDIKGDREDLIRLAETVQTQLLELGFPQEDRAFLPHLTLGRLKNAKVPAKAGPRMSERFISVFGSYASPLFRVSSIALMQSHLSSQGSTYEALHTSLFHGSRP